MIRRGRQSGPREPRTGSGARSGRALPVSQRPVPRFEHLLRLTSADGIYQGSLLGRPRRDIGYRLEDVSRALIVTIRQPEASPTLRGAGRAYLAFAEQGQVAGGAFRGRRRADGSWADSATTQDHWGVAVWAAGTAATLAGGNVATRALAVADRAMRTRSHKAPAMAYAALGAAEILRADPGHRAARLMLEDARDVLRPHGRRSPWPWPAPGLTHASAVLPEALIAIADCLADQPLLDEGLAQLAWLLELQTRGGRVSVVPAGGWSPPELPPGFDQRPVEVAALAEAFWRAYGVTGDASWLPAIDRCAGWFLGENNLGVRLYDHSSGACADSLRAVGGDRGQGAEATLAALSTLQIARRAALAAV